MDDRRGAIFNTSSQIDWQPSCWQASSVVGLAVLAVIAVLASGLTPLWQLIAMSGVSLAAMSVVIQSLRQRPRRLLIPWSGAAPVYVDAAPVKHFTVRWHGPIAVLTWRDASGRKQRIQCWPDTVSQGQWRALALASKFRQTTLLSISSVHYVLVNSSCLSRFQWQLVCGIYAQSGVIALSLLSQWRRFSVSR